ncbi:MAG: hypothetical protein ACOYO1_05465 [Bacteroidales bacterium]
MKGKQPNHITSIEIIMMGELIVNLPVLIIFLLPAILLFQLGINWNVSIWIGVIIAWFAWHKLIKIWKQWAIKKNVERERLYLLGKLGLINFFRYTIFDSEKKEID